jgi:hypothetical protein
MHALCLAYAISGGYGEIAEREGWGEEEEKRKNDERTPFIPSNTRTFLKLAAALHLP